MSVRFEGGLRTCEVITRVPAATWSLLRHQPLLTVVPYGVVRQLVEMRELTVLKMKTSMPLEPIGVLLPLEDPGAATLRLADFLRHFAARSSPPGRNVANAGAESTRLQQLAAALPAPPAATLCDIGPAPVRAGETAAAPSPCLSCCCRLREF